MRSGRRVKWLFCLLVAATQGWLVRQTRRLLGHPPRIWRGMNGLHLMKWAVLMDRMAGFPSRSVIGSTAPSSYSLFKDEDFDVVWDRLGEPQQDWAWLGLIDLLKHGDI